MNAAFTFLLMIFLHIIDDFCLQNFCLNKLKQKQYWEENAPDEMCRHDYIVALLVHGFSWAFMMMLPIAWGMHFQVTEKFFFWLLGNAFVHAFIDNAKANWRMHNLIADQTIHFMQIVATAIVFL